MSSTLVSSAGMGDVGRLTHRDVLDKVAVHNICIKVYISKRQSVWASRYRPLQGQRARSSYGHPLRADVSADSGRLQPTVATATR